MPWNPVRPQALLWGRLPEEPDLFLDRGLPGPRHLAARTGFRRFLLTDSSGSGRVGRRCTLISLKARLPGFPGVRGQSARAPARLGCTRLGSTCSYKHCHKAVFLRSPPPPALSCQSVPPPALLPPTLSRGIFEAENDHSRFRRFRPFRPRGQKQTCITH